MQQSSFFEFISVMCLKQLDLKSITYNPLNTGDGDTCLINPYRSINMCWICMHDL